MSTMQNSHRQPDFNLAKMLVSPFLTAPAFQIRVKQRISIAELR